MQNPPHITHIASGDIWAGAEKQLYELCKALVASKQVKVSAIIFNEGALADKLKALGMPVTIAPESQLSFMQLIFKTRSHLLAQKADLIHTHGFKENIVGSLARIASKTMKSVTTIHGNQETQLPWTKPHKLAIYYLDRLLTRFYQDRIIAVSTQLEQSLRALYSNKVVKIFNFINSSEIQELRKPETNRELYTIGFVGRLVGVKRVDLFIKAVKALTQRLPQLNIRAKIIGDGPLRLLAEKLVIEQQLDNVIEFTGFIDPSTPEIGKLDILVMPSDHEGLPMTLLEALALRVPVVAHNVGGIPEVLDNGKAGVLVADHSEQGYANALAKLVSDPRQLSLIAEHGYSHLAKNFDAYAITPKYLKLYFELI
ncbi:glycosyltransferase family 4 protein [Hahella sp. HN01]|uniref:glycosyltransferase family 4 protein n=1 Tax=unclassified Hahella TaxID=2624107 RepID=UPI001C1EE3B5|nr:glycosyltransferase family 4 protein [Hahella sp. HN01]MBU6950611.1 glycosyltransferase family 4 protein [Hahella sp. HN01]